MKKNIIILVILLIATGFIFKKDIGNLLAAQNNTEESSDAKQGKKGKKNKKVEAASPAIKVVQQWDLPAELVEVSGIAYIDEERFACIQDEEGVIFIFNKATGKIESKIPFAGAGDYEGITLAGDNAYVIRADGELFEIADYRSAKPGIKQYKTPLTVEQNIEGLTYDKTNNRLLLAIKDDEPGNKNYKGIYAFDLSKNKLAEEPVYKIDLQHKLVKSSGKKSKNISPSALGIHPVTRQIMVTDGPGSRLLIMDGEGNMRDLYQLGNKFPQPEGITFSPNGNVYISNEGKKTPGNIIEIGVK